MSRGRGRGRGRGRPFGNMEGIGFGPGEAAPPPILQPPPLFPILERKPLELKNDDASEYLYSIKQELRHYMKESPFYLKADTVKASIDRYSDRYKELNSNAVTDLAWSPEWEYFPDELQLKKKRKRKTTKSSIIPETAIPETAGTNLKGIKKDKKRKSKQKDDSVSQDNEEESGVDRNPPKTKKRRKVTFDESDQEEPKLETKELPKEKDGLVKKLNELEKAEEEQSADDDDIITGDEEYYDEEIEEEGTDYNLTYFDNGEEDAEDDLEENEGPYY